MFTSSEKIKILLSRKNLHKIDLARYLNTSPSNITNRLLRNGFREKELRNIAALFGCKHETRFKDRKTGEVLSTDASSVELIRILIDRRGLNITKFAEKLGIKQGNLSAKLNRNNLSLEDIQVMADVLGYDVDFVFVDLDSGYEL